MAFHFIAPKRDRFTSWAAACAAVGIPLAAYLLTLAPTLTFEDSGQIIIAAARLGICHPSGYPLATLINNFFAALPVGSIPQRVNLASACAATAAAALAFTLWRRYTPGDKTAGAVGAAAAAVAFALNRTVWGQAVVAEVYAVNALGLVALLTAGLRFAERWETRWGYAAAFFAGLAIGAHSSAILVAAPLAIYLLIRGGRAPGWKHSCWAAAFLLLGAGIFLYLPLRAAQNPPLNWGNPRTWEAFVNHATRRAYGGPALSRLVFLPEAWAAWARGFVRDFTAPVALLIAAGVLGAIIKRTRPWGFTAALAFILGPAATAALVLLLANRQVYEMSVWYIPFYLSASGFVAFAVARLLSSPRVPIRILGYTAALAAIITPPVCNGPQNDLSHYYYAYDKGANLLKTLPAAGVSILLAGSQSGIFEQAYLIKTEGLRPDVIIVDPTGTVFGNLAGKTPWRTDIDDLSERSAREAHLQEEVLALALAGRPVYYNTERMEVVDAGFVFVPAGLLFRVYAAPGPLAAPSPLWPRYGRRGWERLAEPAAAANEKDRWPRGAASKYYAMRAWENFLLRRDAQGKADLLQAEAFARGIWSAETLVGRVYIQGREYRRAAVCFERAAADYPRKGAGEEATLITYAGIWNNAAAAYICAGDGAAAARAYATSLAAWPDQPAIRAAARPENIAAALREARAGEAAP